jgi:hypothetical protein
MLNELGRRLLWLLENSGLGESEFSKFVHGPDQSGTVAVHLGRLQEPDKGLHITSAIRYAERCGVDLLWFITGKGTQPAGIPADAVLGSAGLAAAAIVAAELKIDRAEAVQIVAGLASWPWGKAGADPNRWAKLAIAAFQVDKRIGFRDGPKAMAILEKRNDAALKSDAPGR